MEMFLDYSFLKLYQKTRPTPSCYCPFGTEFSYCKFKEYVVDIK